jgi:hypothetical protein
LDKPPSGGFFLSAKSPVETNLKHGILNSYEFKILNNSNLHYKAIKKIPNPARRLVENTLVNQLKIV